LSVLFEINIMAYIFQQNRTLKSQMFLYVGVQSDWLLHVYNYYACFVVGEYLVQLKECVLYLSELKET